MERIGVTIGKFLPLHKGHQLMISFGASMVDHLYVIVSDRLENDSCIPLITRFNWVTKWIESFNHNNITVLYHRDKSPIPDDIDEYGTVLDKEFQTYWRKTFQLLTPDATHFVSSDRYGKTMSDLLGIKWIPVDPDREMFDISATKIREDVSNNFHFIADEIKSNFVKKIVFVGPESTGKSTFAKRASKEFHGIYVPEYGRTVTNFEPGIGEEGFWDIIYGQRELSRHAVEKGMKPYVFSDTEAFTTNLFFVHYFGKENQKMLQESLADHFDLYVLLSPDVQWMDDGTRIAGACITRKWFFDKMKNFLEENKLPHIIISGSDYELRWEFVKKAINQL